MDYPLDLLSIFARGDLDEAKNKISVSNRDWYNFLRQVDVIKVQRDVAKKNNVAIFYLYNSFYLAKKNHVKTHYDNVHLTPEGNDILAVDVASQFISYFKDKNNNSP